MTALARAWAAMSYQEKVYALVRLVPAGQVATYGQIADHIAGCTPRMVGFALSALPPDADVPWQRIINARGGGISPRGSDGSARQRVLLEAEGIAFGEDGRTDLRRYRWPGPPPPWLAARGLLP